MTNKATVRAASVEVEAMDIAPLAAVEEAPAKPAVINIWQAESMANAAKLEAKLDCLNKAKQLLAEAKDNFEDGASKNKEATDVADRAALNLYRARCYGASSDEVSGKLVDVFGAKPKKDGTPGKTPDGQGEHIRKRVVRAFAAFEYVTTGKTDDGSFYDGLPIEQIEPIVAGIGNETTSIWTAYDLLAKVRSENATKVDPVFNPAKVAKFVEKLASDGSAEIIRNSPMLIAAYSALVDVLNEIGNVPNE